MISFQNVSFSYGNDQTVLNNLSLTIPDGQLVCIVGSNGSGKSTMAKLINALLFPPSGTVTTNGYTSTVQSSEGAATPNEADLFLIRKSVGMVFQNPEDQIVSSIVEEEVASGPENLGIPNPELRNRVDWALKRVGLETCAKRSVNALSGGQKQRLAIAGALAMQPKILIFDEASAMLDPQGRKGFMELCHSLHAQGFTIVMTTHFMEEAAQAERIIVLKEGGIAFDGCPKDILQEEEMLSGLDLSMPFSVKLSHLLQEKGVAVSTHLNTETLKEELLCLASNK